MTKTDELMALAEKYQCSESPLKAARELRAAITQALAEALEEGMRAGVRHEQIIQPAEKAQPEPAKLNMPLIWLYSHCRALGMTKHSDSGELEHDIALFVADLKDAAIQQIDALRTELQVVTAEREAALAWNGPIAQQPSKEPT